MAKIHTTSLGGGQQGPKGDPGVANTGDFTFSQSIMNTNTDMTIGVLGVPGIINLSAYAGVNIQTSSEFGLTTNKVITTSNGAGTNVKIGDDAWLGDANLSNHVAIKGVQNSNMGGIVMGNALTERLGTDGNNLTITANNDILLAAGSGYGYVGQVDIPHRIARWSDTLIKQSSVPEHDHGVPGDTAGKFASDATHFYICTADYVNNSTTIWKRINWASGNW